MADIVFPDQHLSSAAFHSPPHVQVQPLGSLLELMAPEPMCFLSLQQHRQVQQSESGQAGTAVHVQHQHRCHNDIMVILIESTEKDKKVFHFTV